MITSQRWSRGSAACLAIFVLVALGHPQTAEQPQASEKDGKHKKEKPYALIFGTAYGPDDRPLYGVQIKIRPQTKNHPNWGLVSDHRGEFAQRVPPGPGDYLIHGEAEYAPMGDDGKLQLSKKKRLRGETKVHVQNDERVDIGLHLTE